METVDRPATFKERLITEKSCAQYFKEPCKNEVREMIYDKYGDSLMKKQ
jgi:hypothetical protein